MTFGLKHQSWVFCFGTCFENPPTRTRGRPFSLKQALLCATCSGAFRTLLVFRRSPLAPTQAAIGPHQAEINPNRGHILFIYKNIFVYVILIAYMCGAKIYYTCMAYIYICICFCWGLRCKRNSERNEIATNSWCESPGSQVLVWISRLGVNLPSWCWCGGTNNKTGDSHNRITE